MSAGDSPRAAPLHGTLLAAGGPSAGSGPTAGRYDQREASHDFREIALESGSRVVRPGRARRRRLLDQPGDRQAPGRTHRRAAGDRDGPRGRPADRRALGLYPDQEVQALRAAGSAGSSPPTPSGRTCPGRSGWSTTRWSTPSPCRAATSTSPAGCMTHLTSEAELASVLGHEIGHVTGRHSVEQMSQGAARADRPHRRHDPRAASWPATTATSPRPASGCCSSSTAATTSARPTTSACATLTARTTTRARWRRSSRCCARCRSSRTSRAAASPAGCRPTRRPTSASPGSTSRSRSSRARLNSAVVARERYLQPDRQRGLRREPARGLLPRQHLHPPRARLPDQLPPGLEDTATRSRRWAPSARARTRSWC